MANHTRRMPSFMDQPFERLTVPHIIQQRYNQPRACSTRQMSLPRPYSTPSPTYTPSRYTSIMTRRPAIRPQVYPRLLQQQPPYHHTTSSLRGIQSVRPTHTVSTNRTGLMNPNIVQGKGPNANTVPHDQFNVVVTGSAALRILETPNRLPNNQTMSPEVSQLLQTLQNKNTTRNTEIPTIDLVDTDEDNDTEQCTTHTTNDSHVETTATVTAASPNTGTYASDENQLHCSGNIDLENNSLDTTVQDTSFNIISIIPVSENTSDDDSTNELLDELNIDLTDLTPATKSPETITVNVINNGPIVVETDTGTRSTENVTCKSPLQKETNDAKTKSMTETEDLNSANQDATDSKLDVKPSIEALQIKVERNLELNTALIKTEQPVNVKFENATKLEKFVDIPSILSKDVTDESQLVVKNESDATQDDTPASIDFSVIDEGMIKSLMASEAKKRNLKRKKKNISNVAKKKTGKARTKTKKCTPLDR